MAAQQSPYDSYLPTGITDEQLLALEIDQLVNIIRTLESQRINLLSQHSTRLQNINVKLSENLQEIRQLKEFNFKLQSQNESISNKNHQFQLEKDELECLNKSLEEDRIRCKRLINDWRKFGEYTAIVMKDEVEKYKAKLTELESRQDMLVSENQELKNLCLLLDGDSTSLLSTPLSERVSGDGSPAASTLLTSPHSRQEEMATRPTVAYIYQLEQRLRALECDKTSPSLENSKRTQKFFNGSDEKVRNDHSISEALKILDILEELESKPYSASPAPDAVIDMSYDSLDDNSLRRKPSSSSSDSKILTTVERSLLRHFCNMASLKLGISDKMNNPKVKISESN